MPRTKDYKKSNKKRRHSHNGRILLDFDGTIHSYSHGWDGPLSPPLPGSKAFVEELVQLGYEVVIFSTRAAHMSGQKDIERWLTKYRFPKLHVTDKKVTAKLIIDDRGLRFNGDYTATMGFIKGDPKLGTWQDAGSGKPWGDKPPHDWPKEVKEGLGDGLK